jgi:hypothetical protein
LTRPCRFTTKYPSSSELLESDDDRPLIVNEQHGAVLEPLVARQHDRAVGPDIAGDAQPLALGIGRGQQEILDRAVVAQMMKLRRDRRIIDMPDYALKLQHSSLLPMPALSPTLTGDHMEPQPRAPAQAGFSAGARRR